MMNEALEKAKEVVGGAASLARLINLTTQAVWQWHEVPPRRVLDVERATGVSRHELRPDLYPPPDAPNLSEAS
jgi:DNA-binding transcriptional regulator YdaS (Cro superfamily)